MSPDSLKDLISKCGAFVMEDGSIITPPARLSWPSLIEATGTNQNPEDKRFRVTLVFPAAVSLDVLRAKAAEAATAKWGDKLKAVMESGNFKKPLIPSDLNAGKYDGYEVGGFYLRATTKIRQPVRDVNMAIITAPDQIYPGMWVRAKLTVRAYDQGGGRGVSFDLVSVQKLADDEKFGSKIDATSGFSALAGAKANGTGNPSASQVSTGF